MIEYSVIIPVYSSAATLEELMKRLVKVFSEITLDYEIIMIEDCGGDNSWEIMKDLNRKYSKLKIIKLTTNYGQHNAIMCGFNNAGGNYIITLDDDLQNPPEEIPKLINEIKKGADVVYGIYETKKHSFFRNFGSNLIQCIYKKVFGLSNNFTSFRIIRKNILDLVINYKRNFTFIDGLIASYTKRIGTVSVNHKQRKDGKSGYSISKLALLSLNMVTNFSILPLRLIVFTGCVFSVTGFIISIYMVMKHLVRGIPVQGYTSIIVSITFFQAYSLLL